MNSYFRIKDLARVTNGKSDVKDAKEIGKYIFFDRSVLHKKSDRYLFDSEAIIIPGEDSRQIFEPRYFHGKFDLHQRCYAIYDFRKDFDAKYLYYKLKTLTKHFANVNVGSTVPSLRLEHITDLKIELPPFKDQKKIASILSSLDSKVELNNKINTELEALAKTLYEYWFVQFDFPNAKGKPYKSRGGKMVWNEQLKREIPEGWHVQNLADLTETITRGISPKYLDSGGICVLNQKCIRENKVLFEFSRRHDNVSKSVSAKKVNLYDVLVNSTGVGTLGRVAIVKRLPEELITTDSHVTIVRANPKKIDPLYFGFSLIQKQKEIEGFSVGSTGQVELSRSQLEGIQLIVPPKDIQNSFGKIYMNSLEKMSVCENENEQLAALRDWLLPMLMNGQVKVK